MFARSVALAVLAAGLGPGVRICVFVLMNAG